MTRKCHNHRPQSETNPRHHEEETQNNNNNVTERTQFISKMNVKLKRTLSTEFRNNGLSQNPQSMGRTINNESTTTEPLP